APIVPLLETASALECLDDWIATPGLAEVYVGLNDLHLSLGHRFMFEPLALGLVDRVAQAAHRQGLRFGFGGIARMNEGQVSGHDVLAEHLRLGSSSVILSRTFHRPEDALSFEDAVAALRDAERELALRDAAQVDADRARVAAKIVQVAASLPPPR
ncbi:MAG TPA: aldolase, partial [Ramlibacter sp.]